MKRVVAILLSVLMLAGLLAGCNSDSKSDAGEDYPTIRIQMTCLNVPKDVALVEEKVSEITREKIGCNVEFIMMEVANQSQQLSLLLSGGDDSIDIFFKSGLSTIVSSGQALDLTELIKPYEKDFAEALGQHVFDCGYLNGKYWGVPKLLNQVSQAMYSIPADLAAEFGYKNGDALTFETLDKLLADIHAKYPDTPLIGPRDGTCIFSDSRIDQLSTGDYYLGVLNNYGQSDTVINYYESEEFLEMMSYIEKWNKAGYYMTDVLNVTEAPIDLIPTGRCFGCFSGHFSAYLNGIWQSENFGTEMACMTIFPSCYSKTPTNFYCVNQASSHPEKAVAMLHLLATDADIVNLMINGIEGVHYKVLEDGSATYMDGKDASDNGWCLGYSWANLNSTISIPFNYPPDYFEVLLNSNETALRSKAFGFIFDTSNVTDEIAACTNVYNQYYKPLFSDAIDDYPAMIETLQKEMKAAGIDKIIAEKQAQLDAFLGK